VNRQPLTDAEIAELVHAAADSWTMPPVRLDAPAWRERVRGPRARRADALRHWLAPLGRAATGAVALTVAAALIAVLLTARVNDPGKSPAPSDGTTPQATDAARSTPLPKLIVNGDLPAPSKILARTEPNTFAIVDLVDGTVGAPLISGPYGSELRIRSNGVMTCLCLAESGFADGSATTATVRLDRFDASGQLTRSIPIESFEGAPDPRDEAQTSFDPLPHVLTAVSYDEGGAYGFVGWSYRAGLAWKSGLLVVDLRNGDIVSRRDLPEVSSGDEDSRTIVDAPRVVGQDGDQLVVSRVQAELSPVGSSNPSVNVDVDAYRVAFPGGILGDAAAVPGMSGCGDEVRFGGILADDGTWVLCTRGGTHQTRLRRVAGDGTVLNDVVLIGELGIEGDASVMSRDGSAVYVWAPSTATMTRVEIETGATSVGNGLTARAEPGPLAALGSWLAPVAAAKSFLASSVVLSADQSQIGRAHV